MGISTASLELEGPVPAAHFSASRQASIRLFKLLPASGKLGQTGDIIGQGLTGTTAVSLNGVPASFTIVSDTLIHATVPNGATTGFVTVVTPAGTLTSNVAFQVVP
jgi:uncharacterized protein (TIGR03437 family)